MAINDNPYVKISCAIRIADKEELLELGSILDKEGWRLISGGNLKNIDRFDTPLPASLCLYDYHFTRKKVVTCSYVTVPYSYKSTYIFPDLPPYLRPINKAEVFLPEKI